MIECVPNVSEGRDPARIARLVDAVATTPGVMLLHEHAGAGANRSVITFGKLARDEDLSRFIL